MPQDLHYYLIPPYTLPHYPILYHGALIRLEYFNSSFGFSYITTINQYFYAIFSIWPPKHKKTSVSTALKTIFHRLSSWDL